MATTLSKRAQLKELWAKIVAAFNFRRSSGKFYTTYTRRLQLINQMRELKKRSLTDIRDRLNVQYK